MGLHDCLCGVRDHLDDNHHHPGAPRRPGRRTRGVGHAPLAVYELRMAPWASVQLGPESARTLRTARSPFSRTFTCLASLKRRVPPFPRNRAAGR